MSAHRPSFLVGAALLAVAAGGASGQAGPVRLQLADGAGLDGRTYAVTLEQTITFGGGRSGPQVRRDARVRFHFAEGASAGEERVRTAVVLDSVRASVSSPHGREVLDLRRLHGTRVGAEYARTGGPATWQEPVPLINYGEFGGPVPLSDLLDYVFPALDGRAVQAGATWERSWQRRQIDGKVGATQPVTTRLTLAEVQTHGSATVARITFTTRAASGSETTGTVVLSVGDGVVREVTLSETVTGTWDMGGTTMDYEQVTKLQVLPAGEGHR